LSVVRRGCGPLWRVAVQACRPIGQALNESPPLCAPSNEWGVLEVTVCCILRVQEDDLSMRAPGFPCDYRLVNSFLKAKTTVTSNLYSCTALRTVSMYPPSPA
jgi:hypothetical protein